MALHMSINPTATVPKIQLGDFIPEYSNHHHTEAQGQALHIILPVKIMNPCKNAQSQYSLITESAPAVNNHGCLGWNLQSKTPANPKSD